MGSSSRVIAIILFMMAVSVVSIRAQIADNGASVNSNGSENVSSQTASSSPYRLKKGDNELGFWGGASFQATTIFGGLKEDEARGRKLVLAAFRYGRTLFATKNTALQYTLDAVPLACCRRGYRNRARVHRAELHRFTERLPPARRRPAFPSLARALLPTR